MIFTKTLQNREEIHIILNIEFFTDTPQSYNMHISTFK